MSTKQDYLRKVSVVEVSLFYKRKTELLKRLSLHLRELSIKSINVINRIKYSKSQFRLGQKHQAFVSQQNKQF